MTATALAGLLALAAVAPGEVEGAPAAIERGVVEIRVAGNASARAWMLAHLAGFVEQLDVDVHWHELDVLSALDVLDPPDTRSPARARVWIDLQQPARAKVYVVDAAWERVLVRPLQLAGGLDEVASEEIGTIVESSVRALLEGGSIGVAREQLIATMVPAPTPEPADEPPVEPPVPPPRFVLQLGLGAGYAAAGWGTGVVQHGPILIVELAALGKRLAIGGRLEGRVTIPIEAVGDPLALRLGGGGARAHATFAWRAKDWFALESAVGAGVDVVTARADARTPAAESFAPSTNALAVLALALGPAFELGRRRDRLLLRAQLGIDVVPHQLRYVTADSHALLFAPWIVRPGGTLVIAWRRRS